MRPDQVYQGTARQFTVRNLLAEQQVVVRVRAYNRIGAGEWSEEVTLQTGPEEEKQLVEIADIPPTWHYLDIADISGDEAAADAAELQAMLTKHQKEVTIALHLTASPCISYMHLSVSPSYLAR